MKHAQYLFLVAALALPLTPARASTPVCESQAVSASARHGLPDKLLVAIARTESGMTFGGKVPRAWPWTANVAGKGYYFKTKEEALKHLRELVKTGVKNFDVGCMQLNYRWHADGFASLEAMIDPATNTEYAARYLKRLRAETGSWDKATRYYHSRNATRGEAYLARVEKAKAKIGEIAPAPLDKVIAPVAPQRERIVQVATPQDRRFQARGELISLIQSSGKSQPILSGGIPKPLISGLSRP